MRSSDRRQRPRSETTRVFDGFTTPRKAEARPLASDASTLGSGIWACTTKPVEPFWRQVIPDSSRFGMSRRFDGASSGNPVIRVVSHHCLRRSTGIWDPWASSSPLIRRVPPGHSRSSHHCRRRSTGIGEATLNLAPALEVPPGHSRSSQHCRRLSTEIADSKSRSPSLGV
jgi:hypothetical protein